MDMDNLGQNGQHCAFTIVNLRARTGSECGNIQMSWLATKGMVDWKIVLDQTVLLRRSELEVQHS